MTLLLLCLEFCGGSIREGLQRPNGKINGLGIVLTGVQGTGKSALGTIIALVLANGFNWKVHCQWGTHQFTTNPTKRQIHINQRFECHWWRNEENKITVFELMISSCNQERWHHQAQQGSWTTQGNLIFIDVADEEETLAMCRDTRTEQRDFGKSKICWWCLCQQTNTDTKNPIDAAYMSNLT